MSKHLFNGQWVTLHDWTERFSEMSSFGVNIMKIICCDIFQSLISPSNRLKLIWRTNPIVTEQKTDKVFSLLREAMIFQSSMWRWDWEREKNGGKLRKLLDELFHEWEFSLTLRPTDPTTDEIVWKAEAENVFFSPSTFRRERESKIRQWAKRRKLRRSQSA